MRDQNALLPLLELGVKPVASAGLLGRDGSHTFRRAEGFDTTGIQFIGAYGEPNLEAIAAELRAAYDARIDGLRDALGADLENTSVSLLSAGDPGRFYQADSGGQAQYTVMRALGLPRPAPQRPGSGEDFAEFSLEQLPEHDDDAVIVDDFSGESPDPGVTTLVSSPLYGNLAATRAGQSSVIDATRSVGSAWAPMDVFIDELARILLDPGFDHDVIQEDP